MNHTTFCINSFSAIANMTLARATVNQAYENWRELMDCISVNITGKPLAHSLKLGNIGKAVSGWIDLIQLYGDQWRANRAGKATCPGDASVWQGLVAADACALPPTLSTFTKRRALEVRRVVLAKTWVPPVRYIVTTNYRCSIAPTDKLSTEFTETKTASSALLVGGQC